MMTEKVKEMFRQAFRDIGYTWEHIYVGSFVDVGTECQIPLRWVFDTNQEKFTSSEIYTAIFSVLDSLEVSEEYNYLFDMLFATNNLSFKEKTEVEL